jgi:hypothetical protein
MMKKTLFTIFSLSLLVAANSNACSDEEFKALDKETTDLQKKHFAEKSAQLDQYLQQIKAKKNLNDKELFKYKTNMLNNPKAKKLYDKEPKQTIGDLLRVTTEKDCKTLKKWADESMESANKQWDIVFSELEKELGTQHQEK